MFNAISALRRPAAAIRFCACTRPPENTVCDTDNGTLYWCSRPNGRSLNAANGFAVDAHRTADSSESTRAASGNVGSGVNVPHSSDGPADVVSPSSPIPWNSLRSVRVYPADAYSCGKYSLTARFCSPRARSTPARATATASLADSARRSASSSDTPCAPGATTCAATGRTAKSCRAATTTTVHRRRPIRAVISVPRLSW